MECKVCKSKQIKLYQEEIYDDRYGYEGLFDIYQCLNCGFKFLNADFKENELTNLYTKYYPRANFDGEKLIAYEDVKNKFKLWFYGLYANAFRWVSKDVKVLDIGCGTCNSLAYHENRNCESWGCEADANVSKIAEKHNLKVKMGLFDDSFFEKNYFDYVTLEQVIEHVKNPKETLQKINNVLKTNGYLILNTPNTNCFLNKIFKNQWLHWHIPYHISFLSKKSLQILAKEAGFEIIKFKTITPPDWLYYQLGSIIEFPKNGEKSIFWQRLHNGIRFENRLSRRKLKILNFINKTKIFNIITILLDMFNLGDNYLIILRKK